MAALHAVRQRQPARLVRRPWPRRKGRWWVNADEVVAPHAAPLAAVGQFYRPSAAGGRGDRLFVTRIPAHAEHGALRRSTATPTACALPQQLPDDPRSAVPVTGVKRDIELPRRVPRSRVTP
jgi:hypothetical protein